MIKGSKLFFDWYGLPLFSGLLIFLLCGGCTLRAQKTQKENIRIAYLEANQRIERCIEEEDPCGLYLNQIHTNADKAPWGVVGTYESTQDLWYQLDEAFEEEDVYQLLKVNITTRRSSRKENEELLFGTDGKLLFYYFHLSEYGETLQAFRFYFSAGKLIDYQEEIVEKEADYREWSKEDTEKVMKKAQKLRELLAATL
jgi:hypothetical protein